MNATTQKGFLLAPQTAADRQAPGLLRLVDRFLPPRELDRAALRTARMTIGVSASTGLLGLPVALRALAVHQEWAGVPLIIGSACMGANLFLIRAGRSTAGMAWLSLGELFLIISFLAYIYGGLDSAATFWLTAVPLAGAYLIHPRVALPLGGLVALEVLTFYALGLAGHVFPLHLQPAEQAWWHAACGVTMTAFMALMGLLAERDRLRSEAEVLAKNEALTCEMAAREVAESALRTKHKLEAVGQLAAGMAHELNTPLQYVGDSVRFFRDSAGDLLAFASEVRRATAERDPGRTDELTRTIDEAAERADLGYLEAELESAVDRALAGIDRVANIVRVVRQFTSPESGETARIDVNQAVQDAILVARGECDSAAVIETELGAVPSVSCRSGDLNQVFVHLLLNAAHAIRDDRGAEGPKGHIVVRSSAEQGFVVVTVTDDGCGISEAIRGRVYDPFFTTRDVGQGSGQGLAVARAIVVDRCGGSIDFDSEVGRGTTFSVRVPLAQA